MRKATLVLSYPAEVTVKLPVEYRYKHYTPEQVNETFEAIANKLGASSWYLEPHDE